jgi:hypothetical protein
VSRYIETYKVNGVTSGIEDIADGGTHYFKEGCKRFRLWTGGCAIGSCNSLEEARHLLWQYLTTKCSIEIKSLEDKLVKLYEIKDKLGNDQRYLVRFEL